MSRRYRRLLSEFPLDATYIVILDRLAITLPQFARDTNSGIPRGATEKRSLRCVPLDREIPRPRGAAMNSRITHEHRGPARSRILRLGGFLAGANLLHDPAIHVFEHVGDHFVTAGIESQRERQPGRAEQTQVGA